ncbi:MAG: HK97 family phage prohead protease [Paracoccaceae bacterium]
MELEMKFAGGPARLEDGMSVAGHASLFGARDGGGDVVMPGAFAAGLARMAAEGRAVRMLWQHDPAQPIGVWDEVVEDATGLRVKGRLLDGVARAREAAALMSAGAIDGLSIGYRATRAEPGPGGAGRRLIELDLWEVSLVTFPMLAGARVKRDPAAAERRARVHATLARTARALRAHTPGPEGQP